MTIRSLAIGRLHGKPEIKHSKTGKPCCIATMLADGHAGSIWVNVIAFAEIGVELAELPPRSVISVSGRCELSAWRDQKTGSPCAGMRIAVDDLIVLEKPRLRLKPPSSKPPSKTRIIKTFNEILPPC